MPLKIKNMKGIDFSCASPSSTAICSSTDQYYMVKNSTKSFNRLNSYSNHHYKTFTNSNSSSSSSSSFSPRAPCISELPFTPRLSSSYREKTRKNPPSIVKHSDLTPRRKSSADIVDFRRFHEKCSYNNHSNNNSNFSPPRENSSRYLLMESKYLDSISEFHHQSKVTKNSNNWALIPSTPMFIDQEVDEKKSFGSFLDAEKEKKINQKSLALVNQSDQRVINSTKYDVYDHKQQSLGYCKNDSLKKSSSSGSNRTRDQVVVLRVSLHCKGCAGKLRKHLSKMEGVTSFSIDLETKKVTVIGNVTPLSVLTSISKVKNAQFWPSATSASPSSSSSSSTSSTVDFH